ncbi:MAG: hypothetical protein N2204_00015 [Anaerolineae bacterium]|nr:hypothetical protein [Anaerolineae bacterium]
MSKNGQADDYTDFDLMQDELYTELDDDRRAELDQLIGLKVLGVELYEDSLGDDEEESPVSPDARVFFDCDLYLEDNQALELYVTSAYPDPDADPVVGLETIFDTIGRLADEKMALVDYGEADEEGGLALAFGHGDKVEMVLVCSAWMVSEWEAEEEDSEEV